MSDILVVGSLAYDSITTPMAHVDRTLGGSANYFSLAASMFSKVHVVGVVGDDYSDEDLKLLTDRGVDTSGLSRVDGKTFHWSGAYKEDMNEAITISTELNVFEHFSPDLPENYRDCKYVFLANIDPELQMSVLEQVKEPKWIGSDTMNFWIESKQWALRKVLEKVDVLLINEGESRLLTQTQNAIAAAEKILGMGPKAVVIKRGEYGFVLFTDEGYFIMPAYPVGHVVDPTGAGDTFAGAFFGYLAKENSEVTIDQIKRACLYGCLVASVTIQGLGVEQLKDLNLTKVEDRYKSYQKVVQFPEPTIPA